MNVQVMVTDPLAERVVLVGWEGAAWARISSLLEAGELPHLSRLIERGVLGRIASLRPMFTPILWTSIATGQRPDRHRILGTLEPTPDVDGVQWAGSTSRKVHAVWNIASLAGLSSTVVNWPASHPAEPIRGAVVTERFARPGPLDGPWELPSDSVHPPELASELAALRVHWRDVGGGELQPFLREAREIDQTHPYFARKLKALSVAIARAASVHAATTHLLERRPTAFVSVRYDMFGTARSTFEDHRALRPGAPVAPDDHARTRFFGRVLDQTYRFHDLMLGRLVQLAGPNALVIVYSDRGSRAERELTVDREDGTDESMGEYYGFVAMGGPGVRTDERLYGSSLLDLAPTALVALGLPVGADLCGTARVEAFAARPSVRRIPSWEAVGGDSGRHAPERRAEPISVRAAAQLRGRPAEAELEPRALATQLVRESRVRLAISAIDAGRTADAVASLEALHREDPTSDALVELLCTTYLDAGRIDAAKPLAARLVDSRAASPGAHVLAARVHLADGNPLAATDALRAAERLEPPPGMLAQLGSAYLELRFRHDAERCFEAGLRRVPDHEPSLRGLARCRLIGGRADLAVELLLQALGRRHFATRAHLLLGRAYARLGHWDRARAALETALRLRPTLARGYRLLAWVLVRQGEHERAGRLLDLARRLRRARQHRGTLDGDGSLVASRAPDPGSAIVVVTGAPRSGTSLAMQMLAAGGLSCLWDGLRAADPDNPRGYFELELVWALRHHSGWLASARGCAFKVPHAVLHDLPSRHSYRVIHVTRHADLIVASHRARCARRDDPLPPAGFGDRLVRELARVCADARGRPEMTWIEVDYDDLVDDPIGQAERIRAFVGLALDAAKMAAAVDPGLRHHRLERVNLEKPA